MVVCSSCCEWYHGWCAEDGGVRGWRGWRSEGGWRCARCAACGSCGRGAARVRCRVCAAHYHASCLPAAPPDHRSDWPQVHLFI